MVVRLRMQEAQRFIAEARAAGASVRALGADSRIAGAGMNYLGGRGFWAHQAMFTLRRTVYGLTLTLGALGGLAIHTGFAFNSMIEQQTLAFRVMTGSAQMAHQEVQFLFDLAAHGPFEFQQVISGARQLQAFGFTIERTNTLLVALQDAMAGMGLDQAALDRATLALGQIQSSGRLLGQDLRQLEQLGLVNPQDLGRRLGIAPNQLGNIGQLNVPSEVAIDAIMAYWKEKFQGAAKDFQHTWVGQISTIKDEGRLLFGAMVEPLQMRLEKDVLPTVQKIAVEGEKGFRTGGMEGFFREVDKGAGLGTNFVQSWRAVRGVAVPLGGILLTLGQDFLWAFQTLGIGVHVLQPLGFVLGVVYSVLKLIQPVLAPLIALWIAERSALLLLAAAKRINIFWDIVGTMWTTRRARAETIYLMWLYRRTYATKLASAAETAWIAVQLGAIWVTEGLTGAVVGLNAAMWSNPIMLLVGATILLVAGLAILYFKWQAFHDAVNRTADFLWSHWYILALIPAVGPFIAISSLIIHNFQTIVGWVKTLIGWIRSAIHWMGRLHGPDLGWIGDVGHFITHPHLQHGGDITRGGMFTVGESGRENVFLPAGAAVRPQRSVTPVEGLVEAGGRHPRVLRVPVTLMLNNRVLAEAVAEYNLDKTGLRA